MVVVSIGSSGCVEIGVGGDDYRIIDVCFGERIWWEIEVENVSGKDIPHCSGSGSGSSSSSEFESIFLGVNEEGFFVH